MFVFEGPDGSGKSTVMKKVAERLRSNGYTDITTTYEPGGPDGRNFGTDIRNILLNPENTDITDLSELFLFMADRADHIINFIEPALKSNQTVLTDRFWESSIVYQQAVKKAVSKELFFEMFDLFKDIVSPACTFVLISKEPHGTKGDRLDKEMMEFRKEINNHYKNLEESYGFIDYPVACFDTTNKNFKEIVDDIYETIVFKM